MRHTRGRAVIPETHDTLVGSKNDGGVLTLGAGGENPGEMVATLKPFHFMFIFH
jgi:hypothetical protein